MKANELEFLLSTEDFVVCAMAHAIREGRLEVEGLSDSQVRARVEQEVRARKLEEKLESFCKYRKHLESVPDGIIFRVVKATHTDPSGLDAQIARDLLAEMCTSLEEVGVCVSISLNK